MSTKQVATPDDQGEKESNVTADVVLFAHDDEGVAHVLLIQRTWNPFAGCWALPGGFVEPNEDLAAAAARELAEETGVTGVGLTQVGAYGTPGRDPRGWVVTVAYTTILPALTPPQAGSDARAARWVPVHTLLDTPEALAFDHHQLLTDALVEWGGLSAQGALT